MSIATRDQIAIVAEKQTFTCTSQNGLVADTRDDRRSWVQLSLIGSSQWEQVPGRVEFGSARVRRERDSNKNCTSPRHHSRAAPHRPALKQTAPLIQTPACLNV